MVKNNVLSCLTFLVASALSAFLLISLKGRAHLTVAMIYAAFLVSSGFVFKLSPQNTKLKNILSVLGSSVLGIVGLITSLVIDLMDINMNIIIPMVYGNYKINIWKAYSPFQLINYLNQQFINLQGRYKLFTIEEYKYTVGIPTLLILMSSLFIWIGFEIRLRLKGANRKIKAA